jgi:hypothetical protein
VISTGRVGGAGANEADNDDEAMEDVEVGSQTTILDGREFTNEEWAIMSVGWNDFQRDLLAAARAGNRVWRMRVGVLVRG